MYSKEQHVKNYFTFCHSTTKATLMIDMKQTSVIGKLY